MVIIFDVSFNTLLNLPTYLSPLCLLLTVLKIAYNQQSKDKYNNTHIKKTNAYNASSTTSPYMHKSRYRSSLIAVDAVEQMEALFIKSNRNDEFNDG